MGSIFLSHSHRDKAFARKLSDALKSRGFRVWLDEAEMQIGDSLITKIEVAIKECEYLGVVLSPSSVASEWVRREVNMALTEEIRGKKVKVLPLLHEQCEIPGFLLDKLYADFSGGFEQGLAYLLGRLSNAIQQDNYRNKRALEKLQFAYQDSISFGKQGHHQLQKSDIEAIIGYVSPQQLSLALAEFLFSSAALLTSRTGRGIERIDEFLNVFPSDQLRQVFAQLLKHPNEKVRLGLLFLAKHIQLEPLAELLIESCSVETSSEVKRRTAMMLSEVGIKLSEGLAEDLLERANDDWIFLSYALLFSKPRRTSLVLSDGSEFASDLGRLATRSGYQTISVSSPLLHTELEDASDKILGAHEVIIVVRGEHFTKFGSGEFYPKLRTYVERGGSLLFTSWALWETKEISECKAMFPFEHVADSHNENVLVQCRPTSVPLSASMFPKPFSLRTSFEFLRSKPDAVVLLETDTGIPVFGYHPHGKGTCYYLNSCQHDCLGHMTCPTWSSEEFTDGLEAFFRWLYKRNEERRGN